MNRLLKVSAIALLIFVLPASAHGGETDANGGHFNSATGEYHYHHGFPAHQHEDGICAYAFDDQTDRGSHASVSSNAVRATSQDNAYRNTYQEPDTLPYDTDESGRYIVPNGGRETDNGTYLQYDFPGLAYVVYHYGLENQSRDFQEGATYGLNRGYQIASEFYAYGYEDGVSETLSQVSPAVEPQRIDMPPDEPLPDNPIPQRDDDSHWAWDAASGALAGIMVGSILLFTITFLTMSSFTGSESKLQHILWRQFKPAAIVFGIVGALSGLYMSDHLKEQDQLRYELYSTGYEDAATRAEDFLADTTGGEVYFEKDGSWYCAEVDLSHLMRKIDWSRADEVQ